MPKRVLDGEAMWASTKLSECPEWTIPEYAWLHPLADANGSFEVTSLRVIWGKVAAIRPHLTLENLQEILRAFHEHGLLFIWDQDGKKYAHWTGSEKPGRLPQPARRAKRYGPLLAPPVPVDQLREYAVRHEKYRSATPTASLVLDLDLVLDRDGEGEKEGAPENGAPPAQDKPRPSPSAIPGTPKADGNRSEPQTLTFQGTHFTVSSCQDRLLAEAFPWVNRQVEYRKADSWLEANPERRPKRASRLLHNWFSKIPSPSLDGKGANRAEQRTRANLRAAGFVS